MIVEFSEETTNNKLLRQLEMKMNFRSSKQIDMDLLFILKDMMQVG